MLLRPRQRLASDRCVAALMSRGNTPSSRLPPHLAAWQARRCAGCGGRDCPFGQGERWYCADCRALLPATQELVIERMNRINERD
jgi:hypothetical protein